jgi:hypothetical protein
MGPSIACQQQTCVDVASVSSALHEGGCGLAVQSASAGGTLLTCIGVVPESVLSVTLWS